MTMASKSWKSWPETSRLRNSLISRIPLDRFDEVLGFTKGRNIDSLIYRAEPWVVLLPGLFLKAESNERSKQFCFSLLFTQSRTMFRLVQEKRLFRLWRLPDTRNSAAIRKLRLIEVPQVRSMQKKSANKHYSRKCITICIIENVISFSNKKMPRFNLP